MKSERVSYKRRRAANNYTMNERERGRESEGETARIIKRRRRHSQRELLKKIYPSDQETLREAFCGSLALEVSPNP